MKVKYETDCVVNYEVNYKVNCVRLQFTVNYFMALAVVWLY